MARFTKNYKYNKSFFVDDEKDKTKDILNKFYLEREGYDEISLTNYLAQKAGLKNSDNLYFDDDELVYGADTITKRAYDKTISKLLSDVKKKVKSKKFRR
tara:strand:- start:309 stop:608 length:300 start_codon:yes stop_codon:yes gene_type:complete